MSRNPFAIYACPLLQTLEEHRYTPYCKRLTVIRQEHGVILARSIIIAFATSEYSPMIRQVTMQRLKAIPRNWYLLPLVPLAMH